jgi:hypothetical protein
MSRKELSPELAKNIKQFLGEMKKRLGPQPSELINEARTDAEEETGMRLLIEHGIVLPLPPRPREFFRKGFNRRPNETSPFSRNNAEQDPAQDKSDQK